MATWSLVATVKAPAAKVLAFVAHHLSLGADHLHLYFDDPDDPAPQTIAALPAHLRARLTTTRCNADHWARMGNRHERHQNRQSRNARDAYQRCQSAWLGHIDADEFLLPDRPVADILRDAAPSDIAVRMAPYEAMHDPTLPDDIYTARLFRGAIKHEHWRLRTPALGSYKSVIRDGILSHSIGKVFFRTGIKGLSPRLHSVFLKNERLPSPDFSPDLRLLHFHAQDKDAWLAAVPFRITRGAYQYNALLQAFLAGATPLEIEEFYFRTQTIPPDLLARLREAGIAVEADLALAQKVAALKDGTLPLPPAPTRNESTL